MVPVNDSQSEQLKGEDRNWLVELAEGDYLDARNSALVWEMVECESINSDRSQLAVTFASGVCSCRIILSI